MAATAALGFMASWHAKGLSVHACSRARQGHLFV
jgi:hypothetical protein